MKSRSESSNQPAGELNPAQLLVQQYAFLLDVSEDDLIPVLEGWEYCPALLDDYRSLAREFGDLEALALIEPPIEFPVNPQTSTTR